MDAMMLTNLYIREITIKKQSHKPVVQKIDLNDIELKRESSEHD